MFKKICDVIFGFVFPGDDTIKENVQFNSIDIPMSTKLFNDFKNSVIMWTLARKLEEKLGVRCYYRENQELLVWKTRDYRGHFILDVYSNGKSIGPYEIDIQPNESISVTSERIHVERFEQTDRSVTLVPSEAVELISKDITSQISKS